MRQELGMRPKALLAMSILGVLNGMRVRITPSQPQNSPQRRQSPLMHPVHGMTLRRAAILRKPSPGLGSREQHSVPSAPAQAQAQSQILPQPSKPSNTPPSAD